MVPVSRTTSPVWVQDCAMTHINYVFLLICSEIQFTDGNPFIPLAPNSYNWVSKCMGPISGWAPAGRAYGLLCQEEGSVCRVHQSLPSPTELNKLIGRRVETSSRLSLFYTHRDKLKDFSRQKKCNWTLLHPSNVLIQTKPAPLCSGQKLKEVYILSFNILSFI